MSTLLATEHASGLHRGFQPHSCIECWPDGAPVRVQRSAPPVAVPSAPRPRHIPGMTSLGDAIARLMERRGTSLVDMPEPEPEQPPDGGPDCATCHGFRWLRRNLPVEDPEFGRPVLCPQCASGFLLQRRIDRLMGEMPEMFRGWTLQTFPSDTPAQAWVMAEARAWLEAAGNPWLYLWGPSGRGKTGLAVALLREVVNAGASGTLKVVPDLLARIRRTYRTREDYEADETDLLEALYAVDLLVLDDIGSEHTTDWAVEKLFQVIGGRHDHRKRTIITSNLSLPDLSERLGHPRTTSRISEMTGNRWVIDVRNLPNMRKGA